MWAEILNIFRGHPELALFLALALGYFIGKIKIRGFSLGATTGTLVAAIVVGQIGVEVSPILKQVFFSLFIFTIGYRVGPQFFASLKSSARVVALSAVFCVTGLAVAVIMAKVFGFDPGTAGGLLAGALTQSATIGTTESALQGLNLPEATFQAYESNVAVTYAVTYMIGTLFVVILMKNVIPRLLKADLKDSCAAYDEVEGGEKELPAGFFAGYHSRGFRAFRVERPGVAGRTLAECVERFEDRVIVEQVRRNGKVMSVSSDFRLVGGDVLAVAGPRQDLVEAEKLIGPEVDDRDLLNIEGEHISVWVRDKRVIGMTLAEMGERYGNGLFLKTITRQGHLLPRRFDTVVHKGDTLEIVGTKRDVERFIALAGYPERPTDKTDLIFVGLGVILGTLLGLLSLTVDGLPLALGAGGGVLVMGLIFGWLRSMHPTFGTIPSPAAWLMQNMGLNLFIGVVGLTAGPKAVHCLATAGVSVVIAGMAVAVLPHLFTAFVGKKFFKMDLVQIIGVLCGAGTCTAALNAVQDEAGSAAPVLFYTPAFAIGNVLLTVWGPVIVALTS